MLITLLAGERVALLFLVFFNSLAGLSVGSDIHGLFYILIAKFARNLGRNECFPESGCSIVGL